MSTENLVQKVRELKELQAMADELQNEIATLQDEVKAAMIAQGAEELIVDVFKVRYKTVRGSRFDSAAFRKTHADLYGQYSRQTEYKRFSIA